MRVIVMSKRLKTESFDNFCGNYKRRSQKQGDLYEEELYGSEMGGIIWINMESLILAQSERWRRA